LGKRRRKKKRRKRRRKRRRRKKKKKKKREHDVSINTVTLFYPKNGYIKSLQNVSSCLPDYTASHSRGRQSS
jgi:hypothetical protein